MRRLWMLVLIAVMTFSVSAVAQDTSRVTVPKSILTAQQLNQVTATNTLTNVSQWVGVGKEVGEAVNGSLEAISKQAVEFAETDVGKLTVNVLIIKLLGPMIVHVVGGIFVLLIGLPVVVWLIRKNAVVRAIPMDQNKDGLIRYTTFDPSAEAKVCYTIMFFAIWALWALVTFSW